VKLQSITAKFAVLIAAVLCAGRCYSGDVTSAQYDNARTLSNTAEIYLNTSNVNSNTFGKLFTRTVDGDIFAQPLYLQNVAFPDQTVNVVYVATMHNNVYAFDADNPSASAPIWSVNLGPYDTPLGWNSGLGVLSTPVIVRSVEAIYVVAATSENGNRVYRLHALDLLSGVEKFGGPVVIAGEVAGTASDGQNGEVIFNADQQIQRSSLALSGDSIYFAFSSDRDHPPYHGWVFGYSTSTLQQTGIFNDTPNGSLGGIWQAGRAPAVDANGSLYYESGNGDFDGLTNFGESFLKLNVSNSGALSLADWFTPDIWNDMNAYDNDLGSSGPTLIPGAGLVLGGGKTGTVFLLNTNAMGHTQTGNGQIVQSFLGTTGCTVPVMDQGCSQIMGQAFWYSAPTPTLYLWGVHDQLKAYQFSNGQFSTTPVSTGTMSAYYPGGVLSISSNLSTPGTGIVWAITNDTPDQGFYFGPGWIGTGSLRAFDATDLTHELWDSSQNLARDELGNFASFTPPTIAGGKVYVPTFSNQLVVYGLFNPPDSPAAGLVGYWSFDSSFVNGTTLLDQSGNNNNATAFSTASVPGEIGQALQFNGTSSYAQVSSALSSQQLYDLTGSLSLSLWVQTTNSSRYEALISKYAAGGSGYGYLLRTTPAGMAELLIGGSNVASGNGTVTDITAINDGNWHHLAVVIALGASVTFYVDGALSSSYTLNSTAGIASSPFVMGMPAAGAVGSYFTGNMDEVKVYDRVLSAGDVTSLFSNQVIAPAFSPVAGTYATAQMVTISTPTSGAWIRYTTDGSIPSEMAGNLYSGPIPVGSTTTINAIAYANGLSDSAISSITYTIPAQPPPPTCPCTIWSSTAVPKIADSGAGEGVELGVKFTSDVSGMITGLRFYKDKNNTGAHIGHLWSITGSGVLLATASFTNETASGWQQVNFPSPVTITANAVYVASYHTDVSHFSLDLNTFATAGVDNPPLHALATGVNGGNGVYLYGSTSGYPNDTYSGSNYWVDVVFSTTAPAPLVSIAVTPASPTVNAGANQQFTATGTYQDSSTRDISAQVTWNSSNPAAAVISGIGLATGQSAGSSNITATLNGVTSNAALLTVEAGPPPTCPCTIWSSTAVPTVIDAGPGAAVELGVKFTSDFNGTITGLRFYKSGNNTGTHIGSLWSSTGTLLASATFTNETASGWQQVNFSSPVAITANTAYVASYHTDVSHFSLDLNAFAAAGVDNPPLHALATGVNGGDGVYLYSTTSSFPSNTYSGSNYWVDVVFSTTAPVPLVSIAVTPTSPTVNAGANQQFTATGTYQDSSTQDISAQVTWNSSNPTAAIISGTGLATGQSAGYSNITAAANSIVSNTAILTVQTAPPPTCPCTIWSSDAVPAVIDSGPGAAVELGVKFTSDVGGVITGMRFYKSTANTGTHIGNLWSSTGALLASATFTNETASGWQQVTFSSPVTIAASTIYVASYHTDVSHFSLDLNAFATAGVDNPPLHALATGVSGGDGVYLYTATSSFPNNTYSGSNYWVDAVFSTTAPAPLVSIAVTPTSPTVNVGANQQFTATGTYQDSSTQDISAQVTWNSSNPTAAIISGTGLARGQSAGSSNITATSNNIVSNTATLTVQTAPPPSCPCTIWSSNAVPTVIDSGPGAAVELGVKFISEFNGTITGLRFYKSTANTGTHIGNLWSSTGTLLASATFTDETASGWQQVNFSGPVTIAANTTYVASYHTDVSHFSLDLNAFAAAGVDNPPLHALATGVSGGDGVYLYSANSNFPSNTYSGSNYWVDVVFEFVAGDLGGQLNGHEVSGDDQGRIVSWLTPQNTAYDQVISLDWNFVLNQVPLDPNNGLPAYFTHSLLSPGNPPTISNYVNNPAGMFAMLTDSAITDYQYSGNSAVTALAESLLDYDLAHGLTPSDALWPQVPYASSTAGLTDYDGLEIGNPGFIEPDKIGELGYQYLRMYEYTGNTQYSDAAIHDADVLAANVRQGSATQSPWPFRVNAASNAVLDDYTADVIKPISLFDELIRLNMGNVSTYQNARTVAWNWLIQFPMTTNVWSNYFEDVAGDISNYDQYIPLETAEYLMLNAQFDPQWQAHVSGIIQWVENTFAVTSFGANSIEEQVDDPIAMGSHTSRYAMVVALWSELTGDLNSKDKAYRAFNWATYMASSNGQVITGPEDQNIWFTDGYGDYARHFLAGMASMPDMSPPGENHLLRSTSVIQSVVYSSAEVDYQTFDSDSTETLHCAFAPQTVTQDGTPLPMQTDLSSAGWNFDSSTGVLKIHHRGSHQISIS
jgi:hypothetical protein